MHSKVHPWSGTFGDVDRAARSLAASLREQGVGAGDVVLFQLPNWVEAGITFWASAYLGAVVVPSCTSTAPRRSTTSSRATEPDVVVTADQFGHVDHLAMYDALLADHPEPRWLVAGDPAAPTPVAGRRRSTSLLDADPVDEPAPVDPDAPAIIAFTSGTTRDPKGVIHSHRTIGFETRQLDYFFPGGRAGADHRRAGRSLHRHGQRVPRPAAP